MPINFTCFCNNLLLFTLCSLSLTGPSMCTCIFKNHSRAKLVTQTAIFPFEHSMPCSNTLVFITKTSIMFSGLAMFQLTIFGIRYLFRKNTHMHTVLISDYQNWKRILPRMCCVMMSNASINLSIISCFT